MKAIVCEMCGSNNVVKEGDFYVCQNCGTKYTPESARKLMVEVEGKVDVSGSSVKVDTTDNVKHALENARLAKQNEDWEGAEQYYNLVKRDEPDNIEAIFYSAYAKARSSLAVNDIYRREAAFKSFTKSMPVVSDLFNITKEAELRPLIDRMTKDIRDLTDSSFIYTYRKDGYGNTDDNEQYRTMAFLSLAKEAFGNVLIRIADKIRMVQGKASVHYYLAAKSLFDFDETIYWNNEYANKLVEIAERIAKVDKTEAFKVYQSVANKHRFPASTKKEEIQAFTEDHERLIRRMKELNPLFDEEEAFDQSEEQIERYQKSSRSTNKKFALGAIAVVLGLAACLLIPIIVINLISGHC